MGRANFPRWGVIDIGSNTIRLLVVEIRGERFRSLYERSKFVRLGLGVDETGSLHPIRVEGALKAIGGLVNKARAMNVETLTAIATSAVRDAVDGIDFAEQIRSRFGVDVEILSGEREAELTFIGATYGIPIRRGTLVVDLGGGSAEIVVADGNHIEWAESLPLGSGRLTERYVRHDPPLPEELDCLTVHLGEILRQLPAAPIRTAILAGGSATRLAALAGKRKQAAQLSRSDIRKGLGVLRTVPSLRIARRYRMKPKRAGVLAAGAQTLQAIVQHYRPEQILVTSCGIREGLILQQLEQRQAQQAA